MAKLKKSEKRLLIGLSVVALVSGIILYDIYGPKKPSEPEIISQSDPAKKSTEPANTGTSSRGSRGGGGGGGGGGNSRGGGGSAAKVDITNIEKHNKPNDCWTTIDGEAYDITRFIQEYQSTNKNIANFCGTYGFEVGFLAENPSLREYVLQNSTKV
jgi:hypothetical protein